MWRYYRSPRFHNAPAFVRITAAAIHFANTALIDGTADPLRPEVLIYELGTNGAMSLVGVEFLVPYAAVAKTATAPVLLG